MLTALAASLALSCAAASLSGGLAGDPVFDEARRLYEDTEYEQAAAKLSEIVARPAIAPADKAEALLWLGLSYAGAGDLDTARARLREALVIDVALALPQRTSPAISTMFEELRTEVQAELARPPPPPPPPTEDGLPPMVLVGGGVAAGGAVAVVVGVVLSVMSAGSLAIAEDPEQFQIDAKNALDAANAQALGAGIALPLGAALVAGGGILIATNLE